MKKVLLPLLLILTVACTTYTDNTRFDGEEEKPAHIRGTVTAVTETNVTVEADPDDPADAVKGTITLGSSTVYSRADAKANAANVNETSVPGSREDVRIGSLISVWIEGEAPIRFPLQGVAARVRVER